MTALFSRARRRRIPLLLLALSLADPAAADPRDWWITRKLNAGARAVKKGLVKTGRAIDETRRGTMILAGQGLQKARPHVVRTIRETRVAVDETVTGSGILAGKAYRKLPRPVRREVGKTIWATRLAGKMSASLARRKLRALDQQTRPLRRAVGEGALRTREIVGKGARQIVGSIPAPVRKPLETAVRTTVELTRQQLNTLTDSSRDLLLGTAVKPVAVERMVPTYGLPMKNVTGLWKEASRKLPADERGLVYATAQAQGAHAAQVRRSQGEYPAVFPEVYSITTEAILKAADEGHFEEPRLVRAEVAQFNELYVRNANAHARGEKAEPHWQAYYDAASDMQDVLPQNRTLDGRMVPFVMGARAHITGDLPRALLEVMNTEVAAGRDRAAVLAAMKRDYERTNSIFGKVTERYLSDPARAGWATSKAWGLLPGLVQDGLAKARQPFGARPVMEAARKQAWQRFEGWVRRGLRGRGPYGKLLPKADGLTPFEDFRKVLLTPNRPQGFFSGFRHGAGNTGFFGLP